MVGNNDAVYEHIQRQQGYRITTTSSGGTGRQHEAEHNCYNYMSRDLCASRYHNNSQPRVACGVHLRQHQ